jgi:hypothetical protein
MVLFITEQLYDAHLVCGEESEVIVTKGLVANLGAAWDDFHNEHDAVRIELDTFGEVHDAEEAVELSVGANGLSMKDCEDALMVARALANASWLAGHVAGEPNTPGSRARNLIVCGYVHPKDAFGWGPEYITSDSEIVVTALAEQKGGAVDCGPAVRGPSAYGHTAVEAACRYLPGDWVYEYVNPAVCLIYKGKV